LISNQASSPYVRVRPVTYSYTRPLHPGHTTRLVSPEIESQGLVAFFRNFARQLFD
jgi:hypothetical protein